jgi:hypothetical protein
MPIQPTPPSAVPEFPAISDRTNYNAKAYAFGSAMPTIAAQLLALANNTYANAAEASQAALTAVSARDAALAYASATPWVSGANGTVGERKTSLINGRVYIRRTVGAWTTDPSADPTNWQLFLISPIWATQTGAYTAQPGDALSVDTSAGAVPITLPLDPVDNDTVKWRDHAGTFSLHALTFLRNGKTIMGRPEDMTVSNNNRNGTLTFVASTNDWRF